MPTTLQRAQVEELIVLMRTQPDSTSAKEVPERFRQWLREPGLAIDPELRALIEQVLAGRP